jgi:hypothetical protein
MLDVWPRVAPNLPLSAAVRAALDAHLAALPLVREQSVTR